MQTQLHGNERLSIVVESGSCSHDYRRWEARAHCGHAHRSVASALRCLDRLTRYYCQHGRAAGTRCRHCRGVAQAQETSATWYHARLHTQSGERRSYPRP